MKRILLIHTFGGKMRNETWITENNTLMMLSFFDKKYTNMNGIEFDNQVVQHVTDGIIFHYD